MYWEHIDDGNWVIDVKGITLTNLGQTNYDDLVCNYNDQFQFDYYGSASLSIILHAKIQV